MIRLKRGLSDDLNSQHLLLRANLVDVSVEEREVKNLVKIIDHLLEAELMVEVAP